jgi:Mce-associated membrane protein
MRSQQEGQQADANEDGGEGDEGKRRRRLWPPTWPLVAKIVAAIVVVGSLAGSGVILWQHHNASVRRRHAEQFIDTAKQGVVAVTSIDFNTVRDQVRHIIDNSTGVFRDDFTRRSDQFIQVAQASKAVAKGTVTAAAVESMKTDEAVVLVVGSEEVTNSVGNQQPRTFRFRVTVTRDSGELKVSKLELVL